MLFGHIDMLKNFGLFVELSTTLFTLEMAKELENIIEKNKIDTILFDFHNIETIDLKFIIWIKKMSSTVNMVAFNFNPIVFAALNLMQADKLLKLFPDKDSYFNGQNQIINRRFKLVCP